MTILFLIVELHKTKWLEEALYVEAEYTTEIRKLKQFLSADVIIADYLQPKRHEIKRIKIKD